MFDIGFSEIVICAVVALLVIGPERMPEAVRTIGLWIGRLKRGLRETRTEIERQIGVDDIRRQLHNEDIMRSLEDARRDMDKVVAQTQASLNSASEAIEHQYQTEPDLPYHAHYEENLTAIDSEPTFNNHIPNGQLLNNVVTDSFTSTTEPSTTQIEPIVPQTLRPDLTDHSLIHNDNQSVSATEKSNTTSNTKATL